MFTSASRTCQFHKSQSQKFYDLSKNASHISVYFANFNNAVFNNISSYKTFSGSELICAPL